MKNQGDYYKATKRVNFKKISPLISSYQAFKLLESNASMARQGLSLANLEVFDNGHYYFKRLFADMRKAKNFIHIDIYIINPGEL